jgi:hypothetical protein
VTRWNGGSKMFVVTSQTVARFIDPNYLNGVAVVGTTDGWAVGQYVDQGARRTLIERFEPCR